MDKEDEFIKKFITALEYLSSQIIIIITENEQSFMHQSEMEVGQLSTSKTSASPSLENLKTHDAANDVMFALFDMGVEDKQIPPDKKHYILSLICKCLSQLYSCINYHIDNICTSMSSFVNSRKVRSAVYFLFYKYGNFLIEGESKEFAAQLLDFHDDLDSDILMFDGKLEDEQYCPKKIKIENQFGVKYDNEMIRNMKITYDHWWWSEDLFHAKVDGGA